MLLRVKHQKGLAKSLIMSKCVRRKRKFRFSINLNSALSKRLYMFVSLQTPNIRASIMKYEPNYLRNALASFNSRPNLLT
jgi:hypothetical protein